MPVTYGNPWWDPFGILQSIGNGFINACVQILQSLVQGILGLIQTLASFVQSVPLPYTTQNPFVQQGWLLMTGAADLLLGLVVLIGAIQLMYGQMTRSMEMPLPQFVGRALLTALLIHLSAFLGETLLTLNNAVASAVGVNLVTVITRLNAGGLSNGQIGLFEIVILLIFALGLLRLVIQGIKRIVLFNLLFVLAGPAFLMSFHPATQSIFASWVRRLIATAFEQCIQVLGLGLGIQFLFSTGQTGIPGFLLAIGIMNLSIEIPSLVSSMVAGAPSVGMHDNGLAPLLAGAGAAFRFLS